MVIIQLYFLLWQGSVDHCVIGVQLLAQLTAEMNQISESDANKSLTKHRKIASSFRDSQLYDIFQLSCTLLRTALENSKTLNFNDESQHGLMTHLLRLGKLLRGKWYTKYKEKAFLSCKITWIFDITCITLLFFSFFPSSQLPHFWFYWHLSGWK